MMPASELLFPAPRSTPGDPAAYWPDTGFLALPRLPLTDAEIDELERAGAPKASDVPFPLGAYVALAEHEQTHWIQTHAFGYGRFQTRIDHARTEIAESFFGLFEPGQLHALLQHRLNGEGILQLTMSQRPRVRRELGPVAARLQRHWWGLGLLRHELDAGCVRRGFFRTLRFRFGLAALYAEAGPDVSSVALLSDAALEHAALAHAPEEDVRGAMDLLGGTQLTTAAIAECAAVLNQHWFYAHQAEASRRASQTARAEQWWATLVGSWESKELTFYGDAFAVFGALNPTLDLNASAPLATLGVVCSVALDGVFPPEHEGARRWADVAPPVRFVALASAIGAVGLLPAASVTALDPRDYDAYVQRLCDAAAVAAPRPYASEHHSPARWGTALVNDLRHLHHDAATAAAVLYQKLPAAIVAPTEANVYRSEDLLAPDMDALRLAREAPLLVLGEEASSIGIDEMRFWRCAVAGTYQRLLLQLLGDTRPLRRAGLPTCVRGTDIVNTAFKIAETTFGIPIPFAR